jgi:hypothetical protein
MPVPLCARRPETPPRSALMGWLAMIAVDMPRDHTVKPPRSRYRELRGGAASALRQRRCEPVGLATPVRRTGVAPIAQWIERLPPKQ